MAFNWQTFKTRTLTAIVFAVVMLGGLLWNQWSFFILFSIIHFGCWWEYLKLIEKIHQVKFHNYLKFGLMMMSYGLLIGFCWLGYNGFFIDDFGWREFFFSLIPIWGFILLPIGLSKTEDISPKKFWNAAAGTLYISLNLDFFMILYLSIL